MGMTQTKGNEPPQGFKASIEESNLSLDLPPDETLWMALEEAGINPNTECGGMGVCGQCRVQFKSGAPTPSVDETYVIEEDDLNQGWRLACQTVPDSDCHIVIPKVDATPGIRVLTDAVERDNEPFDAADRRFSEGIGAAVDIGTTTVACYLVDLESGQQLGVSAFANPQRRFGPDVIARILYAHQHLEHLSELQRTLVAMLESHLLALCKQSGIAPEEVVCMTAVGNSTMMHLLWHVDPWSLGVAPYQPVFTEVPPKPADALGFKRFPAMQVELLPAIAGHLGADTVGGVLTLDFERLQGPCLFLDLGTNGELVLFKDGEAVGCTCAAGPAFEGVHISCGTPAIKGAIDRLDINEGQVIFSTLEQSDPLGLCGSGLADTVSALINARLLDAGGRLRKPEQLGDSVPASLSDRIRKVGKGWQFVLHESPGGKVIAVSQKDIRQVQLAKAAFRTGIEFLLEAMALAPSEVAHVYVGGGFGSHLRMDSLVTLGVVPDVMRDCIEPVGNVAGLGARQALTRQSKHRDAARIGGWIKNILLESQPRFTDRYMEHLSFPDITPERKQEQESGA